ncbi:MAG: response regulator transcription factor [Candidatus Acidiferrales bacterium]
MEKKVGVLILCSNRLLREFLARTLSKKSDIRVVAAQPTSPARNDEFARSGADVLVLDSLQLLLEDEGCIQGKHAEDRSLKCVLVAMEDDSKQFLKAVRGGALGYVLQEASAVDVVAAVRAVAQGETFCPPHLCRVLFEYVASQAADLPSSRIRTRLGLTRREQQLIPLIGQGLTNKEIANHLNLSEQTIKNHLHRILRKVGVGDRLSVFEACQTQELGV